MSHTKKLIVTANTPSMNTSRMLDAVTRGASIENIDLQVIAPDVLQPEDIISSNGLILGTTENLGYMAGTIKDIFDRCYYPCLEKTQGLPFAYYIRAGHDGTGTLRAITTITTGLKWRLVREPLICKGDFKESFINQCEELGLSMAASLDIGII